MLKAAMNGSRISRSKAIYMAPSTIHHIHPYDDDCFRLTGSASPNEDFLSDHGTCCLELELDRTVAELTAVGLSKVRHLKVQIVEKEGHWFALNSAQLELCRRLEKDGLCAKVKVDVVPSHEVPLNVRNLMTLPVYDAVIKSNKAEEEEEGQLTNEQQPSPANRACGIVVRGRKGYQQLDQDEEEDNEDEEKDRKEEKTRRSDASKIESNHDEDDDDDDTEDGSSPEASGDSNIDWSEEVDNLSSSSAGEWSDEVEDGDRSNCSDVIDGIMTSEEDDDEDEEGNCLL